ncbi:MAG: tetratricopeptide repeat protein [Elusimicrobiales bacterium]|nr:tetratricopeptide repeat protein [Elusimicrobiales bacterium]
MIAFKSFQLWLIYGLVILSFAVNLLFLVKVFYSLFFKIDIKKRILAALALLLIFSSSMFFLSSAAVRGGYDNNHDFGYLSGDFFNDRSMEGFLKIKELSPLITDSISDNISGFSLDSILIKNKKLMFFTALTLLAILIKLNLEYSAVMAGFGFFYFNFLVILNANTFSTTSSNIFFFMSSLLALVCFHMEKKSRKSNLIWALSAMFLVFTSRYELFIVSFAGFLTVAGIYFRERSIKLNIFKKHGFLSAAVAAYFLIYIAWFSRMSGFVSYNGPEIWEVFNLIGNLKYQLIERNAAFFMSQASLIVPALILLSFFMIFLRSLKDRGKAAKNIIIGSFLFLWIVYVSIIFKPLDAYPLHFMRHRLYFFIPFVILFAFSWDSAMFFLRGIRFFKILKPAMALSLILIYALSNIRTVESLQNEIRTNDIELEFLAKVQKEMGDKYVVVYPANDSRASLLKKYFPFHESCLRIKEKPYVKYVSSEKFITRGKGDIIQAYHPSKSNYISEDDKAVFELSFKHKFYTIWPDLETRDEIPVKIGFYYADRPKDKAWILNSKGYCELKTGKLNEALKYFEEAVKIDSKCIVCAYNLSAAYAFLGREKKSLLAIKNNIESRDSYGAPVFEKALIYMASNEKEKAKRLLESFMREDIKKNKRQNEIFLAMSSMYLNKLNGDGLQGEKHRLRNNEEWNKRYKKLSDVPHIKKSKKIAAGAVNQYMAGDIESAQTDFKKAININPRNMEAQISMCSIISAQKKFKEALKYCDAGVNIAQFPDKHSLILPGILADTLFLRAEIYGNMKKYEKAKLDFKKALKIAPVNWKDIEKAKKGLEKIKVPAKVPGNREIEGY